MKKRMRGIDILLWALGVAVIIALILRGLRVI
jgi:hypothetical protein